MSCEPWFGRPRYNKAPPPSPPGSTLPEDGLPFIHFSVHLKDAPQSGDKGPGLGRACFCLYCLPSTRSLTSEPQGRTAQRSAAQGNAGGGRPNDVAICQCLALPACRVVSMCVCVCVAPRG